MNFLSTVRSANFVAIAMENALLSRFPRTRYVVGLDGQLLVVLHLLPGWLGDTVYHVIMKPTVTKLLNSFYKQAA